MCNPIFYGMAAGAAIGGITGGPKGALLGGAVGGLGGWGFSALGGAAGSQILLAGDVLSQAPVAASGIFGSIGNFLTSPGFSIGEKLIGFGVQMVGARQQAAFQRAQIAYQQAILRNRQIAVAQDIKYRQQRLQIQKGIIGAQGAQARGLLRVEAAGRGVLVDVGSEAAKTEQLAGDVAFAKLVTEQKTALQDRQDRMVASGLLADRALLDFQLAEGQRASVFGQAGTAFKLAAGFSKFRFNVGGELEFRT